MGRHYALSPRVISILPQRCGLIYEGGMGKKPLSLLPVVFSMLLVFHHIFLGIGLGVGFL